MERIASFEKVSFNQFFQDWDTLCPGDSEDEIRRMYEHIQVPCRATAGSAGYDFFAPHDILIKPREQVLIPTGIHAKIKEGYVLMLFPRSSLGFKFRLQLDNTVGIVDSDYIHARNGGHIYCKLTNDTHEGKPVIIKSGEAFIQGVFLPFGITNDDDVKAERTGGIGSTTKGKK